MLEFKRSIFKDQKFCFNIFKMGAQPSEDEMTPDEKKNCSQMRNISMIVIGELGGQVIQDETAANFVVFYQSHVETEKIKHLKKEQKLINFKYITECYFQMLRIRLDSKSEL